MRPGAKAVLMAGVAGLCSLPPTADAHQPHACPDDFPDAPTLAGHLEQADIAAGGVSFQTLFEAGRILFEAPLNLCDGQGRPNTTGAGEFRATAGPAFIRTSAPDASACAGCHFQPRSGGGGDFVANVFVLAQGLDPVTDSVSGEFSNERNTLGMFGAGPIEMLAREMSAELQAQAATLEDGTHVLSSKGVEFEVTLEQGGVVASQGVDTDLVIKPFHQAGVVRSLREFTVNAFNHHHGMQAEERFDLNQDKGFDSDFDRDGVVRELTVGDITAAVLFQAALATPGRVLTASPAQLQDLQRGEQRFTDVGCASCHRPTLVLDSRWFSEPHPGNPAGTFSDTSQSYRFDMTEQGELPRLEKLPGGKALVRAFTDLKRHDLCDDSGPDAIRHFCNETLAQTRPDQDDRPGTEFFITRRLWDVGNSAPYGHRGDLTTITEAILVHGGEARPSRDAFVALPVADQALVVRFLKSLQVLPEGIATVIGDPPSRRWPLEGAWQRP